MNTLEEINAITKAARNMEKIRIIKLLRKLAKELEEEII